MKTNIYDWSDEYDQVATAMIKFIYEHASLNTFYDLGFHMEVHRTRLLGRDFSKTYDFTKTYHENDYRSPEGVRNTSLLRAITENYRKVRRWCLT